MLTRFTGKNASRHGLDRNWAVSFLVSRAQLARTFGAASVMEPHSLCRRDALKRCLKQAAVPYLSQIWLWVFHGRLQPLPGESHEFFIVSSRDGSGVRLGLT